MTVIKTFPSVQQLLPHRGVMCLIDQIEDFTPERLIASTTIKANSPFFDGHFPNYPILPGVILVEMMFQTCGLFGGMASTQNLINGKALNLESFAKGLKARSIGIDKLMFKKPVYPKDELLIEVKPLKRFLGFSTYMAKIIDKTSQELVVKGKLTVFLGKINE